MQRSFSIRDAVFTTCVALLVVTFATVMPGSVLAKAPGAEQSPAKATVVDINTATAEELTALPGVGSVMAERIVKFREEHGDFKRIEDLLKVKGIGEKSFQKIRPAVKISKSKSR